MIKNHNTINLNKQPQILALSYGIEPASSKARAMVLCADKVGLPILLYPLVVEHLPPSNVVPLQIKQHC